MSTPARELRSMSSFDPAEPAILHDCNSGKVETWTGENEADFRKNSVARPDGTSPGGTLCSMDGATCSAAKGGLRRSPKVNTNRDGADTRQESQMCCQDWTLAHRQR